MSLPDLNNYQLSKGAPIAPPNFQSSQQSSGWNWQNMAGSGLLGSFVSGVFNLIGTGVNALTSKKAQKRQWEHDKEVYEQQKADALEQWNRQNEYDSPKAQMERYADAGLNPNLIYGQQSNGSVAANMPDYQSSENIQPPQLDLSEMVPAAAQMMQMELANKQLELETDKYHTDKSLRDRQLTIELMKALDEGGHHRASARLANSKAFLTEETNPYQVEIAREEANQAQHRSELMRAEVERIPLVDQKARLELDHLVGELILMDSKVRYNNAAIREILATAEGKEIANELARFGISFEKGGILVDFADSIRAFSNNVKMDRLNIALSKLQVADSYWQHHHSRTKAYHDAFSQGVSDISTLIGSLTGWRNAQTHQQWVQTYGFWQKEAHNRAATTYNNPISPRNTTWRRMPIYQ